MRNIPIQPLAMGISMILLSLFSSFSVQAQKGGNKIELKVYSENVQKKVVQIKLLSRKFPNLIEREVLLPTVL
mgnify:CR=1 FL=1